MIERFLHAALLTGDDCLVAPNYGFKTEPEGVCGLLYDPPGGLIGSIADDMHGGSCIFVRREAFRAIGGFTEHRGIGFEDYEFHVRCQLAGLRWDIFPEFIYRYRMPQSGNVSRSTNGYKNQVRVLGAYEERLRGSGIRGLPLALASAHWRLEHATEKVKELDAAICTQPTKPARRSHGLDLLLLTCYFPFGIMSGTHRRDQEMIRYLGSRHRLTLVTSMTRDQLAPVRREAFRYLAAIRGVEGSQKSAAEGADLPARVRRHYTDHFQAALRALPTRQYHAALIDMIFMAEFRKDINSPTLLTEHNIESRLLRQMSGHSWKDELPEDWRNSSEEADRLESYEDRVWPEFPVRAVVSEEDRAQMNVRTNIGKTIVATNGADPSIWLPRARRDRATALFPAHLSYPPNVDALEFLLEQIWPKVRKQNPRARLILAGREPAPSVRLAAAAAGVELSANPKSMDAVARRASITVVPLRLGSGSRCKILESMAWGLPVVSTKLGAEGIEAMDGEHLLIRDDPKEFADAMMELMSSDALWDRLRKAGRDLIQARYSWDRVFEPLETALIELVS
jgi:glycosyltransferase involved in cell wall biosynthesis